MKNIIFYIIATIASVNLLALIFLFFYFGINKWKYEKIIAMYYKSGFELYTPYYFYSLVGFFGSFMMVYYFLCLKKNKKPLVMYYKNPDVYHFFNTIPEELYSWMNTYYKVSIVPLCCLALVFLMGLVTYIYFNFLL